MWGTSATEPELKPKQKTPETTQDDFVTVTEITKPLEHLINTLLEQRKPEVTINMAGTSNNTEEKINVDEPEQKGELKLNQLKPFRGKREDLKKFLQDVHLYLYVNNKTYYNDVKKISFTLSFMNNGDAALWKEQLLEDPMVKTTFDLGT